MPSMREAAGVLLERFDELGRLAVVQERQLEEAKTVVLRIQEQIKETRRKMAEIDATREFMSKHNFNTGE